MKRIAPAVAQIIAEQARAFAAAPHGARGALLDALCESTGQSRATVYRQLAQLTVRAPRRRRSDAGKTFVTLAEAQYISGVMMESHRKGNKQLMKVAPVLDMLRYEGTVRCAAVDADTGEIRDLSPRAVERALRMYRLHPEQLLRPAPAVELQSLHPNHVWQIDASLCVLYYLRNGERGSQKDGQRGGTNTSSGLQVLDADKFYKNKPRALERIESERVWRYIVTDHYSGALFCHYVMGAESGMNLAESFMAALQQRTGDVLYGVPFILMMDMGSANTSGLFKNLARRLMVRTMAHAPGNARATGQVEKAQDIWECNFEAALKFQPVHSLQELNANAALFARHFNAQYRHSRHGRSRAAVWQEIQPEQLRLAPPADVCRALLTHEPEQRKVSPQMTVRFAGHEYDVSRIPHVAVGEKLLVALNVYALQEQSICVVDAAADGSEVLHVAPLVERNSAGFRLDANVIGEDFKRHAETQLQANRKLLERLATGADTDTDAAAARKARVQPFGGRFDPLRQAREAVLPLPMPKSGTELQPAVQVAAQMAAQAAAQATRVLTHFEAAKELLAKGVQLSPERHALVRQLYPQGVPESEVAALAERLQRASGLRLVAAGGAA